MDKKMSRVAPSQRVIGAVHDGQRLDNYLLREWRGTPRTLVYRLIRSGQVRVNKSRAKPRQRLNEGDCLRLPPLALPSSVVHRDRTASPPPLQLPIVYEDDHVLAIAKPSGLAVHGGSGAAFGVIETLRAHRANADSLELVHRLDKETSGILLLAKKRSALRHVQMQWRERHVNKIYTALVFGRWRRAAHQHIRQPLKRIHDANGNRRVIVAEDGKEAKTTTRLLRQWEELALVEADMTTGRTHQLRVHLAEVGLPIVGDDKYGYFADNRYFARNGYARMFLHATKLSIRHPQDERLLHLDCPFPPEFERAAVLALPIGETGEE